MFNNVTSSKNMMNMQWYLCDVFIMNKESVGCGWLTISGNSLILDI